MFLATCMSPLRFLFEAFDCYIALFYLGFYEQVLLALPHR
jgi:hypothetical protein